MFKNIIKNQLQLVMVILLMFLSVFVFTISDSSSQRLTNSSVSFNQKSNLHDAVITLEDSSYNFIENDEFRTITNASVRNELIVNYLKNSVKNKNSDMSFRLARTETRNFNLSSGKTFKAITLDSQKEVDSFVVSYGMPLEMWDEYANSLNDLTKRWVYLSEAFANENNIKVNDIIRLNDDSYGSNILVKDSEIREVNIDSYSKQDINTWLPISRYSSMNWFQVVGFGSSADFSAPIISTTSPLPNKQNEGLVFVNPKNFGWEKKYLSTSFDGEIINVMKEAITDSNELRNYKVFVTNAETQSQETLRAMSKQDVEVYYSIKFNKKVNIDSATEQLNEILTNITRGSEYGLRSNFTPDSTSNGKIAFSINDKDYKFYFRTSLFDYITNYFKLIMYISTVVIALIGVWILLIMLKNQIQKTFSQNGVLISLGYKRSELIISNCLYPVFISVIGGISGYLIALPFQNIIVSIYQKFFTIEFLPLDFSWIGLVSMVFGLFVILLLITLLTYSILFNKYTTLQMINYENASTTNKFNIALKKVLTRSKKFSPRFKGAILASSVSKFISITSVMLVSSIIVSIGVIAPNMLSNYMKYSFIDNEYDNQIEYEAPLANAPTTFLKTYNPNSNISLEATDYANDLLEMYLNNDISADVYKPKSDVITMTNLLYKNLNKEFLQNTNLDLETKVEGIDESVLKSTIISSVWSDYKNFNIDKYSKKETLLAILNDEQKLKDRIDDVENLRLFYLKYRRTIGLNVRRPDYFIGNNNLNGANEEFISKDDITPAVRPISHPYAILLDDAGKINSDGSYEKSFFDDLSAGGWYAFTVRYTSEIYNWIKAFFIDNIQQGFLQGIYSSSPESMRKIMAESFNEDDKQFNALFNVIPYTKETDDLGIYSEANSDNVSFKVYGINEDNKTQNLLRDSKHNLLDGLFENKKNIIINETLAKRLKLKVGDEINFDYINEKLMKNGEFIKTDSWDVSELNATSENGFSNQQEMYASSPTDVIKSGLKNKSISDGFIYNTEIDSGSETMTSTTNMTELVNNGEIYREKDKINNTYYISGISRQYGNAKAWVQNETIKADIGYSESEALLFQIFLKEWSNPKIDTDGDNLITINSLKQLVESKKYEANGSDIYSKFKEFKEWANQNEENKKILKLFENEYPIFNYKASKEAEFNDVSKGLSVSQQYGDFSSFGLNGGQISGRSLTGYQVSSMKSIIQLSEAKKIQKRVMDNITLVVIFIVSGIIALCIIIIMLIVNLVIVKYQKIIAVMKVLGYKNSYILSVFVGMYIPIVMVTTILGYIVGVLSMWGLTSGLASNGLVVPFFAFTWWYPIAVLGIVWIIYVVSSITSWEILKRIRLLLAVQEG
ncbi:ABC transporter permease [Spiroplasma chinense]|uniref:ABC transporter permease n=2 Tax=Spiroplasma chinense TaxID=216932 RepID=A0A5B9Y5R5_9MOLU|nr:ABC transporter permease [Spiroplasma chinense]